MAGLFLTRLGIYMLKHNHFPYFAFASLSFGMLCPLALGTHSRLPGFSPEFLHDYDLAEKRMDELHSAEPFLALLSVYRKENEQAELELSIALVYEQRSPLDFAKAVPHFTATLRYDLPEQTLLEVLQWRAYSQDRIGNSDAALRDYLRQLLICTHYFLPSKWPEREPPKERMFINSSDPINEQRIQDYNSYVRHVDYIQFLLRYRQYAVNEARRMRSKLNVGDVETIKILSELSPDSTHYSTIVKWLQADMPQPWP